MNITFHSLFTSIAWGSIAIIVICHLKKSRFLARHFGIIRILFLYLFCTVRFIAPFEFVFTKVLPSSHIVEYIYRIIHLDRISVGRISILHIIIYIWIVTSFLLIVRLCMQYHNVMRKISTFEIIDTKEYINIYKQVTGKYNKNINIRLRRSSNISIPMGIGLINKSIVLPEEEYTDMELYYILLHEYTHFINHDLLVKMMIQIFCCIYWWNPAVYLLRKDLGQTLEIKCDMCVTSKISKNEKIDYMDVIISSLKKITISDNKKFYIASLIDKKYKGDTIERFHIIKDNSNYEKSKGKTMIWISVLSIMVFASYSFVVQPCYEVPLSEIETDASAYAVLPENSYIEKKDGVYTIILGNGNGYVIPEEYASALIKQGFEILEVEN